MSKIFTFYGVAYRPAHSAYVKADGSDFRNGEKVYCVDLSGLSGSDTFHMSLFFAQDEVVLKSGFLRDPVHVKSSGNWSIAYDHESRSKSGVSKWQTVASCTTTPTFSGKSRLSIALTKDAKGIPWRAELPLQLRAVYRPAASRVPDPLPQARHFTHNDLAIIFPNETGDPLDRVLWANQSVLKKISPFWRECLSENYEETRQTLGTLSRWSVNAMGDLDDILYPGRRTDDTTARTSKGKRKRLRSDGSSTARDASSNADQATSDHTSEDEAGSSRAVIEGSSLQVAKVVRYVVVKDYAKSTYEVVLYWVQTSVAKLTPLAGDARSSDTACDAVYDLADYLQIDDLANVCLTDYAGQLTPSNAFDHLLSVHAYKHEKLQEAAYSAVKRYWLAVKKSHAPLRLKERIDAEQDANRLKYLTSIMQFMLEQP